MQTHLSLEGKVRDGEEVIEKEGIKFIINSYNKRYFEEKKLDYVKGFFGGPGQFMMI